MAELNKQSGDRPGMSAGGVHRPGYGGGMFGGIDSPHTIYADGGGASRFFPRFHYYAKCPPSERHAGCGNMFWRANRDNPFGYDAISRAEYDTLAPDARATDNVHPTVKSLRLMRWLHSLANPRRLPIGDLCGGSGSGAVAAFLDGYDWVGAEICPEAVAITEARLKWWRSLSQAEIATFTAKDVVPRQNVKAVSAGAPSLFDMLERAQ